MLDVLRKRRNNFEKDSGGSQRMGDRFGGSDGICPYGRATETATGRYDRLSAVLTDDGRSNDEPGDDARHVGDDAPDAEPDAKDVHDHGSEAGHGPFPKAGHIEDVGRYDHHHEGNVSTDWERQNRSRVDEQDAGADEVHEQGDGWHAEGK